MLVPEEMNPNAAEQSLDAPDETPQTESPLVPESVAQVSSVATDDDQIPAVFGQFVGNLPSEAARSTCYQRDFLHLILFVCTKFFDGQRALLIELSRQIPLLSRTTGLYNKFSIRFASQVRKFVSS